MGKNNPLTVWGLAFNLVALLYHFFLGVAVGLAAPIVAVAAMVAGVRLLTGKMPFFSQRQDATGERYLVLDLIPPEEVGDRWAEQKRIIGDDLGRIKAELQTLVEAQATRETPELVIEA